jgi:hypothetical protein
MAGISSIVARQIGSLQGKLVTQVQGEVLKILKKFSNQCPDSKELQQIITTRNTLIKHIDSFQKRVNKFSTTSKKLDSSVKVAKTTIQIITAIPIPTAVAGAGIPISILTKYSNALIKLNKTVDSLESESAAIKTLIASISPQLTGLRTRLQSIDNAIEQCAKQTQGGSQTDLQSILATAQPKENTGSEGIPNESYQYKGYVLGIVQDLNSPKIAPKRFATATDNRGIVVLRGQSSFSSSTQVLLDEIKFRIDQLQ